MHVYIEVPLETVAQSLISSEALKLITAIDLVQADSGFTEQVIVNLIKSMQEEFNGFPEELAEFNKTILELLK